MSPRLNGPDRAGGPKLPDGLPPGAHLDEDGVLVDADGAELEPHPDDIPEINQWLTIGLFVVFVAVTVWCFFYFEW